MKIYEALGVKKFKKLILLNMYIILAPCVLSSKPGLSFKEIKKEISSVGTNYFLGSDKSYEHVKEFKLALIINSLIHMYNLILLFKDLFTIGASISITHISFIVFFGVLNLYCIMLQRYNYIRINNFLTRMKPAYEKKRQKEITMLKEEDSLLKEHTYKIINNKNKETTINLDELIANSSVRELQAYRKYLLEIKKYNNSISEFKVKKKKLKIYYK